MRTEMSGPAPENRVVLDSVYEFIFARREAGRCAGWLLGRGGTGTGEGRGGREGRGVGDGRWGVTMKLHTNFAALRRGE